MKKNEKKMKKTRGKLQFFIFWKIAIFLVFFSFFYSFFIIFFFSFIIFFYHFFIIFHHFLSFFINSTTGSKNDKKMIKEMIKNDKNSRKIVIFPFLRKIFAPLEEKMKKMNNNEKKMKKKWKKTKKKWKKRGKLQW